MTTRITTRDWEALSAYLDNQLNAKDRDRLVSRLDENPELRSALDELRRTRAVLRSQPPLRAPRNFTLTAEMAGARAGFRPSKQPVPGSYPIMRLASVLATIFFIIITVGELAVRTVAPAPLTVAVSRDQPAAVPFGMGGGGGGAEAPPAPAAVEEAAVEAPAMEASVATEVVAMEALAPNEVPAPTGSAGEQEQALRAMPSEVPDQKAVAVTPLAPAGTPTPMAVAKQAVPGEPEAEGGAQPEENVASAAPAERQTGLSGLTLLHIMQILLALLAFGSGLAALYLRRSARS